MKTRLLRRLRKEAKEKIWVKRIGNEFKICGCSSVLINFKFLPAAKLECDKQRRSYILECIAIMRPVHYGRIY